MARKRANLALLPQDMRDQVFPHGPYGYNLGCRCEICAGWRREYDKNRKNGKKETS